MKNYLKHLKQNPMTCLWLLAIWSFCIVVEIYIIKDKELFIADNSILIFILFQIFIATIFVVANYQPYKEWKDGGGE